MGQTFGAIESTPKIWDIAAAWLLLEELNCSIEWLEMNPMHLSAEQNLQDTNSVSYTHLTLPTKA